MNKMLPSELSYRSKIRNLRMRQDTNSVILVERLMPLSSLFTHLSQKIKGQFKPKEHKPPIVNQQNVVYYYKCGLCDAD